MRSSKRRKSLFTAVLPYHLEPLEARSLLSAAPAAAYDPTQILVRFRDAAVPNAQNVLANTQIGRQIGRDSRLHPVQLGKGVSVDQALAAYRHNPNVAYAEPNWLYTDQSVPNDPSYADGSLWGMYGDQSSPASRWGSQAAEAWANGITGSTDPSNTVYVGVIDEGIDYNHPDLAANAWTNPYDTAGDGIDNDGNGYVDDTHGWDFYNHDNTIYDSVADDHGTHVTGTIAAQGNNGIGVAGVDWNVKYISAKFLGSNGGSTADAIAALDYFTDLKTRHGMNIVATNNSWGGAPYSQALADAITRSARADILFVAAAGNDGLNSDAIVSYPSAYDTTAGAGYDAVISVAAINSTGGLADFSNYGAKSVDLAAPGVGIWSTLPGGGYGFDSGTSMATPHVTGAVALYAAAHPHSSASVIRNAILDAARVDQDAYISGKVATGGILDVSLALQQGLIPAAPSNLSASAASSTQVNLAWTDNAGNEDGFKIERSTDSAFAPAAIVTLLAGRNASSFQDSGLSPLTTYYYRVSAYRSDTGSSAASNAATVTTNSAAAAPNTPGSFTAVAASDTQVNLTWVDTSGDESGFRIERSTTADFASPTAIFIAANATSYTDSGLQAATTYYYRISAYRTDTSAANVSVTSTSAYSPVSATTTAVPLGTGTGLRGDYYDNMLTEDSRVASAYSLSGWKYAQTNPTINFNWGTGSPAQSTAKLRLASDTFTVRWSGMIQPRFTDNYTFRFEPDDGVGMWITVNGVKQPLWTPTWDRLDGATTGDKTSTEYANTSAYESAPLALQAGTKYPVEIVYYEYTGGASAKLMWRSATYQKQEIIPQSQLYQGPTDLKAVASSPTQVNLTWTDNASDEGGFKVERSTNGTTWSTIATLAANATSFTNTGLAAGAKYYYRVTAYNGTPAFASAYSNVVTITMPLTMVSTSTASASSSIDQTLFSCRLIAITDSRLPH